MMSYIRIHGGWTEKARC